LHLGISDLLATWGYLARINEFLPLAKRFLLQRFRLFPDLDTY
jgi:hypothetical protein